MKTSTNKLVTERLLTFDPGTKNFGVSATSIVKGRPEILHLGLLKNPITDLKNGEREIQEYAFTREVLKLIRLYQPSTIVIERFQNRGRGMGALVEKVSYMIGLLARICRKNNIQLILYVASQWKNDIKRKTGKKMEEYYKHVKPNPPHVLDAFLLGMYYAQVPFHMKYLKRIAKWEIAP